MTSLCSFLLYNKVVPFFIRFFSHIDDHRTLGRVLCALQQVPVGQSFHRPQGAHASPNPHPPSSLFIPSSLFVVSSSVYCFLSFFFFLSFSRATPEAYGGSQARGPMGAVATELHHSHSHAGSKSRLRPTPQLMATLGP